MSNNNLSRLYTSQEIVKNYVSYRPEYTSIFYDKILSFCDQQKTERKVAIDICCGSGQNTKGLIPYFDQVIGVDVSETQLEQARLGYPSVKFYLGPAENMSFQPDASVDLVTCATGYHYLDTAICLPEIQRILKPNGVFAIYTLLNIITDKEEMNDFIKERFCNVFKKTKLGEYSLDLYKDPLPWLEKVRYENVKLQKIYDIAGFIGLTISSGLLDMMYGDQVDKFLSDVRDKLMSVYTREDGTELPVNVTFFFPLIIGRNPNGK